MKKVSQSSAAAVSGSDNQPSLISADESPKVNVADNPDIREALLFQGEIEPGTLKFIVVSGDKKIVMTTADYMRGFGIEVETELENYIEQMLEEVYNGPLSLHNEIIPDALAAKTILDDARSFRSRTAGGLHPLLKAKLNRAEMIANQALLRRFGASEKEIEANIDHRDINRNVVIAKYVSEYERASDIDKAFWPASSVPAHCMEGHKKLISDRFPHLRTIEIASNSSPVAAITAGY